MLLLLLLLFRGRGGFGSGLDWGSGRRLAKHLLHVGHAGHVGLTLTKGVELRHLGHLGHLRHGLSAVILLEVHLEGLHVLLRDHETDLAVSSLVQLLQLDRIAAVSQLLDVLLDRELRGEGPLLSLVDKALQLQGYKQGLTLEVTALMESLRDSMWCFCSPVVLAFWSISFWRYLFLA